MGKVARPRIVTKDALDTTGLPEHVQVVLAEIAGATREGVLALSVACGLQVVGEIMAADVTRICGPRSKHTPEREVYRHGTEPRLVPLGGALVDVDKPRMRSKDGREVPLPSYGVFAGRDLLDEVALGRMLAGLSTRRYRAGEAPMGEVELKGTSRSSISRRFRRATEARLAEIYTTPGGFGKVEVAVRSSVGYAPGARLAAGGGTHEAEDICRTHRSIGGNRDDRACRLQFRRIKQ